MIVLRAAAGVEGRTVSATSLEAPKAAVSAFEKGTRDAARRKWEPARQHLEKAVRLYPRYAAAWSALGKVHSEAHRLEAARTAWRTAVSVDAKFIDPYFGLAELAMHERKWVEMAELTGALVKLNPYDFPGAWAYDAMARLNLNQLDAAEKSAREGLRIDALGLVPKNEHLLGVVRMRKGDYQGALAHLRRYLEMAPEAADAAFVEKQISACAARARDVRASTATDPSLPRP
jgi:tetratricopeptide (TPR) repeat protein